jgi:hypothetical protein
VVADVKSRRAGESHRQSSFFVRVHRRIFFFKAAFAVTPGVLLATTEVDVSGLVEELADKIVCMPPTCAGCGGFFAVGVCCIRAFLSPFCHFL